MTNIRILKAKIRRQDTSMSVELAFNVTEDNGIKSTIEINKPMYESKFYARVFDDWGKRYSSAFHPMYFTFDGLKNDHYQNMIKECYKQWADMF